MGTKGREIVGLDVGELIDMLNRAFSDEWLAYYQYWLGSKVVKGPMKNAVAEELLQHSEEELSHADMIANRIIQLGGTPVTTPKQWYEMTHCGYFPPDNPLVMPILEQNIKSEQCAIGVYQQFLDKTRETDPITHDMVLKIIEQEIEHEEDLQALKEDIELLKKSLCEMMSV